MREPPGHVRNPAPARGARPPLRPPPRAPLWLALHFPRLPIDRQATARGSDAGSREGRAGEGDDDEDTPRAIIVREGPRRRVVACNEAASDAGVRPGLALNNALAVAPDLVASELDEAAEAAHLEQLTLWAFGLSSRVTPRPPDLILFEAGASLKLFGGLRSLLEKVRAELAGQGVTVIVGMAPTPSAAMLFARAGIEDEVRSRSMLANALARLPIGHLPLDEHTFEGLRQSGMRTLGELMQLPPPALARRFGAGLSDLLYRLDGRLPDPQTPFRLPGTFSQGLDLPLEAPDTGALAFPLNRLLAALGGFLTAGDSGVHRLDLHLYHPRVEPTVVTLRFLDATANVKHLLRVASERLATTVLPAPVIRVKIEASRLAAIARDGGDLFERARPPGGSSGERPGSGTAGGLHEVMDRLAARLGQDALYTAVPGDDHRPEKAWLPATPEARTAPARRTPASPVPASPVPASPVPASPVPASPVPASPVPASPWPARPLWLYREPRLASVALEAATLPERIENGWWSDVDVRRDYWIARDATGAHYWVFSARDDPARVWIHGLFS